MKRIRILIAVAPLAAMGLAAAGSAASAATMVPYTDASAKGYIGLCNQKGQQITSGSVDAAPFVWRAVSSQAAPAGYATATRTATVFGFVAMGELPPGDWGGEQLTASTRYSNPSAPMAQFTGGDEPLSTLISDYPPEWNGFYELRIFLGAANQAPYEVNYPILNIQVKGDTWYAVGGGPVNCNAGQAESVESILLPKSRTSPTSTTSTSSASNASPASTTTGGGGRDGRSGTTGKGAGNKSGGSAAAGLGHASKLDRTSAAAAEASGLTASGSSTSTDRRGSTSNVAFIGGALGVVAAVVYIWYLAARRRTRGARSADSSVFK